MPSIQREDSIDLIRALAIISVLLFHYTNGFTDEYMRWVYTGPKFSYGYLGLQLFFILSGYCIYLTIRRSKSLADFFAKRLARIWPALIICATLTFIVVHIAWLPNRTASLPNYLTNLLLLFPLTERYVDGAYWTLMVELKYYFLFGILYFLDKKNVLSWWFRFCLAGILIFLAGTVSGGLGFTGISTLASTVSTKVFLYPYAILFLAGIIIYEWKELSASERMLYFIPAACTLGLTAISGLYIESLLIVALILFCIAVIPKSFTIPTPLRVVGLVSYPLYLIHQNIGVVIIRTLAPIDPYLRMAIAMSIVIAIAAVIHYVLEARLRKPFYTRIRALLEPSIAYLVHIYEKTTSVTHTRRDSVAE